MPLPPQFREFLIYFLFIALVAIAFSTLASAFEQVETREVNALVASSLVSVDGNLNFNQVLPGHDYKRDLKISLNLTQEMLDGLNTPNVTVFVKVSPLRDENSSLLFEVNGEKSRVVRFALLCSVLDGICSKSSALSKNVIVFLHAPVSEPSYVDKVIVNASLAEIPLEGVEEKSSEVLESALRLQKQVAELRALIEKIGSSSQETLSKLLVLENSVSQASKYARSLDVVNAEKALLAAETQLVQLKQETQKKSSGERGLFTGRLFGYNFSISWEPILVLLLLFSLYAFYLYRKRQGEKGKRIDIDRLLQQ